MIFRYYPQIHFYIHFRNQNSHRKFLDTQKSSVENSIQKKVDNLSKIKKTQIGLTVPSDSLDNI